MTRRRPSGYYTMREYERTSGYTPDLIKHPIDFPAGYFEHEGYIIIVMNSGKRRAGTDEEEVLWAEDRLKLPRLKITKK